MNTSTKTMGKSLLLIGIAVLMICVLAFAGMGILAVSSSVANASAETLTGSGTAADPYLIGTKAQLETFRDLVNGGQTSICGKLTADIDLEGSESDQWTPIGTEQSKKYVGTFDGDGHKVSGLYIHSDEYTSNRGFFGVIGGATIENLILKGQIMTSNGYSIGGIAAFAYLQENVDSSGFTIRNCLSYVSITGRSAVAGIVSRTSLSGDRTKFSSGIINCGNSGNITSTFAINPSHPAWDDAYAGGILGNSNEYVTIGNCYNTGDIQANCSCVGGIVGAASRVSILNCYNTGAVTGYQRVGGIAGNWHGADTVNTISFSNCHNVGTVTGEPTDVHSVIGTNPDNNGSITGIYSLGTDTHKLSGTPLTADEMKDQANFEGWDFVNVWKMGRNYPVFGFKLDNAVGELTQSALLNGEETTTTVSNLNKETAATLLTEEELERFNDGESINVYLEVTTEKESLSIPAADKSVARTALSTAGAKEGAYLDLSLFKQLTNDEERTAIHESETSFDITIDIPADLAAPFGATRTYSIVRVHNGVAETLESTVADGKISFSTNKFSTYLIAYSDTFDANGEYIEFTSTVAGETTRFVDGNEEAPYGSVVVTYKMTHNDGFNSILLIPEYDTDVFAITSVSVNEEVLGEATITQGNSDTKKILLENTGDRYEGLDGENEYFLTVTYSIIAAANGEYDFGLVLTSQGENTASVAYYIGEGESKGDQTQVAIKVIETNALTLVVKQDGVITIGGNVTQYDTPDIYEGDPVRIELAYVYTYAKTAMTIEQVAETTTPVLATDFLAEYTYNGDGDVTVKWYYASYNGYGAYVKGAEIEDNGTPIYPGYYYVGVSAAASSRYYAVEEVTRFILIDRAPITVTIDSKEGIYLEAIKPLTSDITSGTIYNGDTFEVALSTTATSSSNVGEYDITGSVTNAPFYNVSFVNGTYTINKKEVTLTALDQEAVYTGSEPTVDQTKYTITGIADGELGVQIAKAAGVNAGTYTLTPSIDLGNNYDVTIVTGIFTIITQGKNQEYIESFFAGLTKTYNGTQYDLLYVDPEIPSWIAYVAENNLKTNANDYTINITVTLTEQDALNYTDGEDEFVFTKAGKINPAAVTLSTQNVNLLYGEEPVVPSFTVTVTSGDVAEDLASLTDADIDFDYEIKNGGVAFTPVTTTAVGVYDIVLIEGENPNFTVTYVDGTYTVSKATATVSAAANNVYYNRDLSVTTSASVNLLSLTPVVTYYTDSACTQETTPVNAGTYYVKAVVAGTDNYNGAEAVASFEILPVKLEGVTFTYSHGNATWTAVANDIGKTADETGVAAAALKAGTTVTYKVYAGDTLVDTTTSCTFDALAATNYKVVATASDDNYLDSESAMVASYAVTFDEGEHLGNPTGTVTGMPGTQYIFAGQSAVAPQEDPAVYSCTFDAWQVGGVDYAFTEAVNGNITVVATWEAVTYKITLKYLPTSKTAGTDVFTISGLLYNATVSYEGLGVAPEKSSDNAGIYYTFANKWTDENSVTYNAVNSTIDGFTVDGDMTFIAVFDTNYNAFTITYYLANGVSTDANAYQPVGETQSVTYGDPIEYRPIVTSQVAWFKIYGWYSDMGRTANLLTTMPNENISVYAGYVFDIGTGDVNGDGLVNANDITLYRQWIVGGYDVIAVEEGEEWATATSENYDAENHYFLRVVADNNVDDSRDIRDVSITRMSIVTGYSWDIVTDTGVTGEAIVRSAPSYTISALANGLNTYGRARMYQAVTAADESININATKGLYLDLGGYTLTVQSLTLTTSGKDATITITNGTIIAENGITVAAPNGNVVIDQVTAYVDGQPINLQAADSSLHFAGVVEFYQAEITSGVINVNGETAPAAIRVEEGTHVVVEAAASIVIEKIIVTENVFQVPVTPSETATITLDNKTETEVQVQGNTLNEISDLAGLIAAAKKGGSYVITANIAYNGQIRFENDTTIDLNGYTIRSMTDVALSAVNGATLTINGEGAVMAQEACVMAFNGSTVIINGGTYTAYDNFVVGTNGSTGKGGNTITVNGGVFNGNIQSAGYIACGIYAANDDTITVNGGTFNITNGVGILARSGNTTVGENVVFNMLGENNISGKVGDKNRMIDSGDVLVIDRSLETYPGGLPVLTNNTAYDITVLVSSVEDINAVKATAAKIVLESNITVTATIEITKDLTLDLNGHNITANDVRAFYIKNGAVSIIGAGTISSVGGANLEPSSSVIRVGDAAVNSAAASLTIGADVTISSDRCYGVTVFGKNVGSNVVGQTLTVYGTVSVTGTKAAISGNGNSGLSKTDIVIKNGAVISAAAEATIYQPQHGTLAVESGATINNTNGVGIVARSGATTVASGAIFNVAGDGTLIKVADGAPLVPSGTALVLDIAADYPDGAPTLTNGTDYLLVKVTKVNNAMHYTRVVKTAADLADTTSDIELAADITITATIEITNDLTIDLNGHNITADDVRAFYIKNGTVSIVGEGTISSVGGANLADGSSVIRVGDAAVNSAAASLTIGADVTISSDRCYGVSVFGKNVGSDVVGQTLTVYGTVSVTGNASAISGNGNSGLSMTNIVIKDGAVISATADAAIYQPQRGTLLIESGAALTGPTALYVKSGNVTVEDGAILTATKTTYSSYAYYGNGPKATGDAIVIDNCYYPGNNPTVTLGENLADTVTVAAEGAKKVSTYWAVSDAAQFDAALGAYASYIALKSDISLTSPIMAYLCDFTLDMNGHNITSTSNVFIVYYYGVINFVGTGTIETTGANTTAIVLYGAGNSSATGYASVTIGENVTVKSNDFAFSIKEDLYKAKKSAYCAELNVAGTIIANSGISVLGNVERFEGDVVDDEPIAAVAHVNVKGTARIYASTGAAIYAAGFAKYTVEEGAYLQGPTALYIKSGYVTVEEGATLEATLEDLVEYTYSSGGFTPTGDAIVIDNCNYPGGNAVVTIAEGVNYIVAAEGAQNVATYEA